ncbi:hypothetical protein MARINOS108_20217 [Marinoscillum sp. 108]|nr:hypothetical protein MARINOS108_20217 [Marinoscillum sp. 108]
MRTTSIMVSILLFRLIFLVPISQMYEITAIDGRPNYHGSYSRWKSLQNIGRS